MLNFLPQKNKEKIIEEYFLRLTVLFLSFTLVSVLVLILLFTPSFFFVKYKNDTIRAQLDLIMQSKDTKDNEDPIMFVKKVNALSGALSNGAFGYISSEIIDNLINLKNQDIRISSIVISDENASNTKKVVLSGIAATRDSLTSYEKDIKTDGNFESVVFPVSSFIKSSNSDFTATLIYKNK